ncbi:hypothetical protein A5746_24160 [Mycolicibacterium conceptionense]|uniref:Uncharacterized protein n=1 Tax=Mycolicibacterium senegalense TaxID=1796 RepID=A0ABR5FN19_9MYCO|nr:hypothetical protein AA982_12345 [Mycolicibacterium senegalense]KLO48244.1 hypothetical protein ABW05_26390 [Mycolicibacterium senegalense]OBJ97096.1 hypothetical protein A5639_30715 [Mycolicibacterium conceptionense]OMB68197.1 hypothetical protein A5741_09930 [Mycolicibacterium conceptionense]OMB88576.1 hypothetical protein A5746_24160 [Mycolicibacterium conceptionense]
MFSAESHDFDHRFRDLNIFGDNFVTDRDLNGGQTENDETHADLYTFGLADAHDDFAITEKINDLTPDIAKFLISA